MSTPPTAGPPIIGAGIQIRGHLTAQTDLVLDCQFDGEIEAPKHAITLGPEARVKAVIFARDVTIHGRFEGRLTAVEIADVRERASVDGDVTTPSLLLAEGARFNGRVEMKRADAAVRVARYRMEHREQPTPA